MSTEPRQEAGSPDPSRDVSLHPARHCAASLPRDVVLFSTADWDHPFWTNKQHVARQLVQHGFRVLYVDSLGLRAPSLHARDVRRIGRRLWRSVAAVRHVDENLWVCSPLALPWHERPLVRWINQRLLRWQLRQALATLHFRRPLVWTYNPLVGPLATALDAVMLVYHCVDDLSAAPHLPVETIRSQEQELAQVADVVFTTSPALQSRLSALNGATYLLPNVADYEHFAKARLPGPLPADLQSIPRPRIGFIGAISNYKLDFDLIAAVARKRPHWHWVLIGQVGEGQPDTAVESLRLANVHLLGPRAYEELPNYLRGFDVATIPAPANPYTAAMFPMKFCEYLAAGRPVIASNVPALEPFERACRIVQSPDEFLAGLERLLQGDTPDAAYCDQLARQFTWEWRTREMLAILQQTWHSRRLRNAARDAA